MSRNQLIRMWAVILVLMIATVLLASAANATSYDANYGTYVGQGQDQTANGGTAVSHSDGGNAAAQSTSKAGSDVAVTGGRTSAFVLGLPAPVLAAPVPVATAACTLSQSSAWSAGWNFASAGGSKQTIDGLCVAERQAVAYESMCKFRSAAATRFWVAREANRVPGLVAHLDSTNVYGERETREVNAPSQRPLADFLSSVSANPWESERDYSMAECHAMRNPAPKVEVREVVREVRVEVPVAVKPAPVVKRKAVPVRRKAAVAKPGCGCAK